MRRSESHGVVHRKTYSERHLTLPFDGSPKLVVTTKKCNCCGERLPLAHFYLESKSKRKYEGQVRNQCVECWDVYKGKISA